MFWHCFSILLFANCIVLGYLSLTISSSIRKDLLKRLIVLSFEDETQRTSNKRYYLSTLKIKEYNVMIGGQNFFHQPFKNNLRRYDTIQKITTGQGDDYITGCLLDYNYFKNYCKMIAIDLSKQRALDTNPKAIQ